MYLKFLALEGFKSFPEWNGLEFSPGISVLVGLNGTGKSNVTDAITWTLGEDDPDVLRSGPGVDLIFCGSQELFPTDAAHVTLVFARGGERRKGALGPLPPTVAKHGERAEHTGEVPAGDLTIIRERHRSTGDRYFVDGAAATEEQVRAALREAGLGSPLASVIRQGALDRLLVLAPDERRRALEGAAGVPHLSARARALSKKYEAAARAREHAAGERQQAERRADLLEQEAAVLSEAEGLDGKLQRARSRALALAYRGDAPTNAGQPSLREVLDVLGLTGDAGPADADEWTSLRHEVASLASQRDALGQVNLRAGEDLAQTRADIADLLDREQFLAAECARTREEHSSVDEEKGRTFAAALSRVEQRFRAYYLLLAPGGDASLPLVELAGRPGESGVEIVARPPGKVLDRVDVLSGGERSLAALSFALALFQEYPSPLFILDEVEPALDDANIGRLQAVLDLVAEDRQILLVSHQQRAKETGDVVFGVERNLDGASQIKFRYEPATLRLEVFRRTWAAAHLRRHPDDAKGGREGAGGRGTRPTVVGTSGSPTQAALLEIFGPASGASRERAFHDDGTFRGIMDAMKEREAREAGKARPGARPPSEEGGEGPGDGPPDQAPSPKRCC